jgi:hypothetical protein
MLNQSELVMPTPLEAWWRINSRLNTASHSPKQILGEQRTPIDSGGDGPWARDQLCVLKAIGTMLRLTVFNCNHSFLCLHRRYSLASCSSTLVYGREYLFESHSRDNPQSAVILAVFCNFQFLISAFSTYCWLAVCTLMQIDVLTRGNTRLTSRFKRCIVRTSTWNSIDSGLRATTGAEKRRDLVDYTFYCLDNEKLVIRPNYRSKRT